MKEQLESLKRRLWQAAGDAWLESNEYYDKRDTPEFDRARYDEMAAYEQILFDAAQQVTNALKVIEIVEAKTA